MVKGTKQRLQDRIDVKQQYSRDMAPLSRRETFPSFIFQDGCVFTFEGITGCCVSLCMRLKGDSYAKI